MRSPRFSLSAAALTLLALPAAQAQSFVNGDFELGNTGFTSGYTFTTANSTEGQYTVSANPQFFNGAFVNFGDHSLTGSGQMMVVNGATTGDVPVWSETIVLPFPSGYLFTVWAGTAVAGGPASLRLRVNGLDVGTPFTLPNNTGSWVFWETSGLSPTTLLTFEILNTNTSVFPNDFYLDDISLALVSVPEPATTATLLGLVALAVVALRRRARR